MVTWKGPHGTVIQYDADGTGMARIQGVAGGFPKEVPAEDVMLLVESLFQMERLKAALTNYVAAERAVMELADAQERLRASQQILRQSALATLGDDRVAKPPINSCPLAGSGAPCFCHWTAPNSPHCVHTPKGS